MSFMPWRRTLLAVAAIFGTIVAAFSAGGSMESSQPITTAAEVAADQ
ncbi:hypothetical protein [Tianweitania sediminis]|uniref:Uncharacterized protein n=1 Tax=Tianweitania sediminis TaxID=1502156 RepID=A0A8J7UK37_9HYPH|nr:hypothetical protein [Tianweitania sediminis]MBP0440718.1 hypothetical protein [Tianweitania sediminis]